MNDLKGHRKSLEMARIDRPYDTSYQWCVLCSNNVSISHHFSYYQFYGTYVIACRGPNLEKSFIFGKQLRLKTIDTFPFMYTHDVVNTCFHIH